MGLVGRSLNYLKPYKSYFALSIFFNIFYAILTVVAIAMMIPVLNILFDEKLDTSIKPSSFGSDPSEWGDIIKNNLMLWVESFKEEYGMGKTLLLFCIFFIVTFLLRNIFRFASQYFFILLKTGSIRDIRIEAHNKILRLPISFFNDKRKGDIISTLSNDVALIESSIFGSFLELFRSPISIIIILLGLLANSVQLTLFSFIIFPVMGTVISLIGRSLKRNSARAQNELGLMFSFLDESITGSSIIKIFGAQKQISKRFSDSTNYLRKLLVKVFIRKELASPISELLGAITIAMVVYYGGLLSIEGKGLQGSAFIAYIGMFYTLLDPIKKLAKSVTEIQKGQISAKRVFDVIDEDEVIYDDPNSIGLESFSDSIEFKNISFSYGESNVIHDFSLKIPKGKTVALVGESGSGKSTLANLLTRFYEPTKGEIYIDGQNIKKIKIDSYRKFFGLVTQRSILFNDTIKNNISLGVENAQIEDIKKAAKIANADMFIEEQEQAYETSIGEGGAKLSGGQQQRICIARAVLNDPPIMVLDEATSALDSNSEKMVQDALENLLQNRTSVVIAHRLSTIQNADLIVVMDRGRVIEQGSHSDLIEKNGTYKRYIELQNFDKN